MTEKRKKTRKEKPKGEEKIAQEEETSEDKVEEAPLSTETPVAAVPPPSGNPFESFTYPFRVIVTPLRAFRRIAEYPDIKGLIVVIGLFLAASAAVQYSLASKLILTINGQPVNLVSTIYLQDTMIGGTFSFILPFIVGWLVFALLLLVMTNVTGTKGSRLRQFLTIAGYAFTVFVIRTAITAALISTLPQVNLNLSAPPATEAEWTEYYNQINAAWGPLLATQALQFINYLVDAWLAILGAIGVRMFLGVSWSKAAIVSATAYLIYLALRLFLGLVI